MSASTAERRTPLRSETRGVGRWGLNGWIAACVTIGSALIFYAFLTHGTFDPGFHQNQPGFADDFFLAQATALRHGHLDVPASAIPQECFVYHAKCYGYFGLTPSLIRLPFIHFLNQAQNSLTPVFMTAAMTLAVGAALTIAAWILKDLPRTRRTSMLWAAIALSLGPASALAELARPAVYEEAIAWSIAFALWGIYGFLRWWRVPAARVGGSRRSMPGAEHQRAADRAPARRSAWRRRGCCAR